MRAIIRAALLLVLSCGTAGALAQEAGRVILSIGDVTIQRPGSAPAAAPVGATLNNGDTIRVGASSNAQVRFVDEAIVALRPGTEFKVDDYNWPGAASGVERAFFSLVKGGLRTVTGVIGKANQQNYRVTTPTAALGIRGTNFNIVHCDAECANRDGTPAPAGTYGGVFDGRIGVGNQAGEVTFGADEFFHVVNANVLPARLIGPPPFLGDRLAGASRRKGEKGTESSETMAQSGVNADSRPQTSPAPVPPQPFVVTEQRIEGGSLAVVGPQVTHILMVANVDFGPDPNAEGIGANVSNMVFSGTGASQTLVSVSVPTIAALDQTGGQGTVGPGGTDMVGYGAAVNAHWGRWVDGKITDDAAPGGFNVPTTGVHYLYSDQITPAEVIAAKTGAFSFNVHIGGTNPTDNSGNIGSFTSGSVNVNFTNRTADLHAQWSVGGSNYQLVGVPGVIEIKSGIGAGVNIQGNNVGSCVGPCGGAAGPIQQLTTSGVFLGSTGNHLPMSISTKTGTQVTSQVQLFYCPTCP
jgi:hypothetical protein